MRSFIHFLALLIALLQFAACKKQEIPTISTSEIVEIKNNTAMAGGIITDIGSGAIISRGICWSDVNLNPDINDSKTDDGTGSGDFTSNMSGLSEATTYYVRAYATNSAGTAYGKTMSFTTLIADIDGNLYNKVRIGTQTWMQRNFESTKYNDGDAIPNLKSNDEWDATEMGAYCWFANDIVRFKEYGPLYNWRAVNSGKLCPVGWHVPTKVEWETLLSFVGSGSKLKETGSSHWWWATGSATNETGFTALAGGFRGITFSDIGHLGAWWSSTAVDTVNSLAFGFELNLVGPWVKTSGLSVRCLKN